jgi:hypothetical protein
VKAIAPIFSLMLSIPKSPVAASIFSGLAGIASIYAGPQGFMLELAGEKEIARVTAGGNGNNRAALPAGNYVLDVLGRPRTHLRWKAQSIHRCVESKCPRGYGHHYGGPVASRVDALVPA